MLKSEKWKVNSDNVDRERRSESEISKGMLIDAKIFGYVEKGTERRISGISG